MTEFIMWSCFNSNSRPYGDNNSINMFKKIHVSSYNTMP